MQASHLTLGQGARTVTGGVRGHGRIAMVQRRNAEPDVWRMSLHNHGLAEYARLCGVPGTGVQRNADLADALGEALHHPGPALVEVISDPDLR